MFRILWLLGRTRNYVFEDNNGAENLLYDNERKKLCIRLIVANGIAWGVEGGGCGVVYFMTAWRRCGRLRLLLLHEYELRRERMFICLDLF
ncbi:hypothetical protein GWI33_015140 [Rhynchophorus ferrugineus]|uniref:Uncharacterized protein n=1 Tax=Rhynchophorus ferrugineus TaxID=354439 RepID=A0A834MBP9_RHYFE|nr:hypothetical protein GWI33_015140 [Rhynchophorus ferrugineus]